jgi:hypothetical protein
MQHNLFLKISENFQLRLQRKFNAEFLRNFFLENVPREYNSETDFHWHYFEDANIYFSRRLKIKYLDYCSFAVDSLEQLKQELLLTGKFNDNPLFNIFAESELNPENVLLSLSHIGETVNAHYDATRDCAVNVGLLNSSAAKILITHNNNKFSPNKKHTAWWITHPDKWAEEPKSEYIMNDGDVYILNTTYTHQVVPVMCDAAVPQRIILSVKLK